MGFSTSLIFPAVLNVRIRLIEQFQNTKKKKKTMKKKRKEKNETSLSSRDKKEDEAQKTIIFPRGQSRIAIEIE